MTKKIITFFITLFTLFLFSHVVFAENAGAEIKDSWNKAANTVQNATNHVEGAMKDAGDGIKSGMQGATNTAARTTTTPTNNNYMATRTNANAFLGMNSNTMWTWFVLAILAVAIIGLIWYYGMQNTTNKNE